MRRLFPILLLGTILAPVIAGADKQEDLEKLRQRIQALQQQMEQSSASKFEAADSLRQSERAISNSNRKLQSLDLQQLKTSADLTRLQSQSALLADELQDLRARLSALLYQQYLGGRREYLQLLLENRDPDQAARDLQYYSYIMRAQAELLSELRAKLGQLDALTAQARQKSDTLRSLRQSASSEKLALERERQARRQILVKISAKLKQQNREITHLQRNEKRLSRLVENLSHLSDQGGGQTLDMLKGRLSLPVHSHPSNRYGARRPGGNLLWKGWFLPAPNGQPVRAVAGGRVVFADWLRGFGNLLIIDHGKGYMSLYANNETLYRQVGDVLIIGDVIATVGSSGGNDKSGLYFELRHNGKPLDPAKWVAKR